MLTSKQHELLKFINDRILATGVSPSFDEMKDALDLRSKSGIHRLIMREAGLPIMPLPGYEPLPEIDGATEDALIDKLLTAEEHFAAPAPAAAKKANVVDLELVSVSLDPEYDTPGVLKDYAAVRGIDTSNFTFLTGPDAAVRHLLAQLGVIREFEGNTIKHSLATVLINEDGRIVHRVDGSLWQVDDFVERMRKG